MAAEAGPEADRKNKGTAAPCTTFRVSPLDRIGNVQECHFSSGTFPGSGGQWVDTSTAQLQVREGSTADTFAIRTNSFSIYRVAMRKAGVPNGAGREPSMTQRSLSSERENKMHFLTTLHARRQKFKTFAGGAGGESKFSRTIFGARPKSHNSSVWQ